MREIKKIEQLFIEGNITRREFISRATALGISLSLASSIAPKLSDASTPKRGGVLRVGSTGGSTLDSLDPMKIAIVMAITVSHGQLRNGLVEIDADGNASPALAESFEPTPDAKQWVFNIRKGVEFHNGKTLDAEDVIYTLNLHRGEKSKSPAKGLLSQVTEFKSDGKYTVIAKLKEGNADFPFLMCDYHLGIFPVGVSGFEIGTGPFKLASWEPGVRAVTKRNPNYWKQGLPYFDEVHTISINDPNSRVTALKSGDVDIIDQVDPKVALLLKKSPYIQLIDARGNQHCTIPLRTIDPPFDNNNVRLALKYAIDREEMLKMILRGFGGIGNDHPIGPSQKFYASELPQREYDPDKAQFYMKKAGAQDYTFRLHTSDAAYSGANDAAILFKEQAAKAKIKVDVVREPADGYWSNIWMQKGMIMSTWGGRLTEDWMFSTAYEAGAPWNDSYWEHGKFNDLLKAARAEFNEDKRREMYVEMQSIVRDEGGMIIPLFQSWLHAASSKLKFKGFSPIWPFDVYSGPERWWFVA